MARQITFLNRGGDTTISWKADRDATMREYVEKLMAGGFTFFIVKEIDGEQEKVVLRDFGKALASRELVISDTDADRMLEGAVSVLKAARGAGGEIASEGVARTADQVMASRTVATPPIAGG